MKEYLILFNSDMVRAILAGRKTQTRRVVKAQPHDHQDGTFSRNAWLRCRADQFLDFFDSPHPLGQPGDHLWVKETFARHPKYAQVAYRADGEAFEDADGFTWRPNWSPSIHMPRKLSRITLEVTDVDIKRLRDMTNDDAIAEGAYEVSRVGDGPASATWTMGAGQEWRYESPLQAFEAIWNSIYARRGLGWDVNPWVWVITFKRVGSQKCPKN